jgi:hypothetical protein
VIKTGAAARTPERKEGEFSSAFKGPRDRASLRRFEPLHDPQHGRRVPMKIDLHVECDRAIATSVFV